MVAIGPIAASNDPIAQTILLDASPPPIRWSESNHPQNVERLVEVPTLWN